MDKINIEGLFVINGERMIWTWLQRYSDNNDSNNINVRIRNIVIIITKTDVILILLSEFQSDAHVYHHF